MRIFITLLFFIFSLYASEEIPFKKSYLVHSNSPYGAVAYMLLSYGCNSERWEKEMANTTKEIRKQKALPREFEYLEEISKSK